MGAIYVMWVRQLKKYWRSKTRMIASLAQPLLFLLALGFGFGPVFERAGGGNYIDFLAPGVIAMAVLFTAMFTGIEVIWDRQFGFLKETLVAPTSRASVFIGRTLGGATVSSIQGLFIFIITLFIGFRVPNPIYIIPAFFFVFLMAFVFTAFGTAIASRMRDMQAYPIIINFIMMPLFFLSGALFPLESSSSAIKIIGSADPLAYGVDAIRILLTGVGHFGIVIDTIVTMALAIIMIFLGGWLFSKTEA